MYSGCSSANSSQAFIYLFLPPVSFLLFKRQTNLDILNIYLQFSTSVDFCGTTHNNKYTHVHEGHKVSLHRDKTPLSYGIDLYYLI